MEIEEELKILHAISGGAIEQTMGKMSRSSSSISLDSVTRKIKKIDVSRLLSSIFSEDFNTVQHYLGLATEAPGLLFQKSLEILTPALKEIFLFSLTCIGPWIFLLLCYISVGLISFSRYLCARLQKPEGPAINRALALVANLWGSYLKLYHRLFCYFPMCTNHTIMII